MICTDCKQPMRRDVGGKGKVQFDTFTCDCNGTHKARLPSGADLLEFWKANPGVLPPGAFLTDGHVESVRVLNTTKPGELVTVARVDERGVVMNIEMSDADWFARHGDANCFAVDPANPAVVGGQRVDGFFYGLQPFPSWTRAAGRWEPPVAKPPRQHGTRHEWDEQAQTWRATKEA